MKKSIFFGLLLLSIYAISCDKEKQVSNSDTSGNSGDHRISVRGLRVIKQFGLYGLTDTSGRMVVVPQYDLISAKHMYRHHFIVMQDSVYYFLDVRDNKLYAPRDTEIVMYNDRVVMLFENEKSGLIDGDGRVVTTEQWDDVSLITQGIARVINSEKRELLMVTASMTPGKAGYIDKNGEYIIPMEYSYIDYFEGCDTTRFNRGVFDYDLREQDPNGNVYHGYKYGLIDNKGNIVLPDNEYDYISNQMQDRNGRMVFMVEKGQRAGVINTHGQLIFPLKRYEARAKGEHEGRVELWMAYEASLKQ